MKNIFIALIIITASYQGWNSLSNTTTSRPSPLYEEPYVVVYGRKSCGFTQQTLKDLKQNKIPFEFKTVDEKSIAVVHPRYRTQWDRRTLAHHGNDTEQ